MNHSLPRMFHYFICTGDHMNRKVTLQAVSLIFFLASKIFAQEGGYVSELSIAKGDTIAFYHFTSTNGDECPRLSFHRPFSDTTTALYFTWTDKLVRWLVKEKIPVEFCVSTDLDRDPEFMHHYQMYITVGHDEYWSLKERDE